MSQLNVDDWDTGDHSAMISIGTHKLYLSAAGPSRTPGKPVVLLMQGMGSTIDEWVAVRRLVLPFARWVEYDRSGLGRSESPPEAPRAITAVSVAKELDVLLRNASVEGPFIIVCHSWGGLTSREFFHLRRSDIAGIVFVDANTENTFDGGFMPRPYLTAVNGNVDWIEASGLATDQVLSTAEWEAVLKEQHKPSHQAIEAAESKGYQEDPPVLAAKKQFETQALGDRPISVIQANALRDSQRMYDAGIAAGNGTEEERALYRQYIAEWEAKDIVWQKEKLKLSSRGRYLYTLKSGHNVQMTEPELVAKEIKWVMENV